MDVSVLLSLFTSGAGMMFGKGRKGGPKEAWQQAAETYGLLHKPNSFWSGPKLTGRLFGNDLTVDVKDRGTASAATRFRLAIPSLRNGLKIKKKGFWNSFRPRVLTGDSAFDNRVVAEGHNKAAVQEFLTAERRSAIQNFVTSFKGAAVTDREISFRTPGQVKNADEMLGAIESMVQVASVLTQDTDASSVGRAAGAAGAAIAATEAFRSVTKEAPEPQTRSGPAPEPEPEPESEPVQEPELTHPERLEPERLEPEQSELPAENPDESIEPQVEAGSPLDSLSSQSDTPSVEDFCATVFAPGALSFAANQKFKEYYEHERIDWTGTLESAKPYSFDFDFGSGRGIKAVLTILESDAAGARNVQAVIGLPAAVEGLEARIGQTVAFTGRLLKVDGLAKRVVIADAELRP